MLPQGEEGEQPDHLVVDIAREAADRAWGKNGENRGRPGLTNPVFWPIMPSKTVKGNKTGGAPPREPAGGGSRRAPGGIAHPRVPFPKAVGEGVWRRYTLSFLSGGSRRAGFPAEYGWYRGMIFAPGTRESCPGLFAGLRQLLGKGKPSVVKERSLYEPRISQIQTFCAHWAAKQDLAGPGPLIKRRCGAAWTFGMATRPWSIP